MPENELFRQIESLETEQRNPNSEQIDIASTKDILTIINSEDKTVAFAVEKCLENIAEAVDTITESFKNGGRLFYFGAGTSGRLGILDAAECPPTFGTEPDMVKGVIAGGKEAVFKAQEGAEDKPEDGAITILKNGIKSNDIVCGIAASGRTPFVVGALNKAKELGITTILISTVPISKVKELGTQADILICPEVGPEVVTGSTRMKSGTAQKLVLNMLTTASMIKIGKTYGNIMIDLQQTNLKLKERSKKILMSLGGVDYDTAENYIMKSKGSVKIALLMLLGNVNNYNEAVCLLENSDGQVKIAIQKALQNK